MTLEEEIEAVEEVVRLARRAAAQHLERATKELRLGSAALAHYKDFLDSSLAHAGAALSRCQELALVPAAPGVDASFVQGLLAGVRESVRLMYVAMAALEQGAGAAREPVVAGPRSCGFCGKTEAETRLVAGPAANICGPCARLACGVVGIPAS